MDNARHTFYNSSGVFFLPHDAACLAPGRTSTPCNWEDRSDPRLIYWMKELVVDPLDASGSTWFACVFTDWGVTRHDGKPSRGGLYRTKNRGITWSARLDGVPHNGDDMGSANIDSVSVIQLPGAMQAAEVYMTTEGAGLWHSQYDPTKADGGLRFGQLRAYPFSHPTRVLQNPFNASELWITSFGNGLYSGLADVRAQTDDLGWSRGRDCGRSGPAC